MGREGGREGEERRRKKKKVGGGGRGEGGRIGKKWIVFEIMKEEKKHSRVKVMQ